MCLQKKYVGQISTVSMCSAGPSETFLIIARQINNKFCFSEEKCLTLHFSKDNNAIRTQQVEKFLRDYHF